MKTIFFLLTISLGTSIAGMELFGWLLVLAAFGIEIKNGFIFFHNQKLSFESLKIYLKDKTLGPDLALWLLWLVAILGVAVNGTKESEYSYVIGNFRWIILLYGYTWAWKKVGIDYFSVLFWRVLIPVSLLVGVYGIVQAFTGVDLVRPGHPIHSLELAGVRLFRSSGFFNNPMTFAHLYVMWFCLFLAVFWVTGSVLEIKKRNWLKVALGVLALALFLSLIRGVWISGIVSVAVMLWLWQRKKFYQVAMGFFITAGLIIAVVPPVRVRVASIFGTQNVENRDRVSLWKANWEIFKEHPLIGIGYTENERRIGEYYEKMNIKNGFHGHAHNVYLQFLAGTGILGLSCYLLFIFFFLKISYQLWQNIPNDHLRDRAYILGIIGAQIALHVGGLTQNNFSDGEVNHNFIFILSLLLSLKAKYEWEEKSNQQQRLKIKIK
ncbi:MAG: O-antigen ligase family protein [Bdellovibrionales bacterium]|nr:O-antigen ligase family protein [Bdellovibrionales bacterium]